MKHFIKHDLPAYLAVTAMMVTMLFCLTSKAWL